MFTYKYKLAALLFLILTLCNVDGHGGGSNRTFVVKGRVVDEVGRPVSDAHIVIYPNERPRENDNSPVDGLVVSYTTDSDGSFRAEGTALQFPEGWTLYVTSAFPSNADPLVAPPFHLQRDALKQLFAFRPILINQSSIDVGNVRVQAHYSLVSVQLLKPDSSHAFTEADSWPPVRLRIWDIKGRLVEDTGLSERSFRKSESRFVLALPNGSWKLEVGYLGRKSRTTLLVPDNSSFIDTVMKLQ